MFQYDSALLNWFNTFISTGSEQIQVEDFLKFRQKFGDDDLFDVSFFYQPGDSYQRFKLLKEISEGVQKYIQKEPLGCLPKQPHISNFVEAAEGKHIETFINIIYLLFIVCVLRKHGKMHQSLEKISEEDRCALSNLYKEYQQTEQNSKIYTLEDKLFCLSQENTLLCENIQKFRSEHRDELDQEKQEKNKIKEQLFHLEKENLRKVQEIRKYQMILKQREVVQKNYEKTNEMLIEELRRQIQQLKVSNREKDFQIQALNDQIVKKDSSKLSFINNIHKECEETISLQQHQIEMKNLRNKYEIQKRKIKQKFQEKSKTQKVMIKEVRKQKKQTKDLRKIKSQKNIPQNAKSIIDEQNKQIKKQFQEKSKKENAEKNLKIEKEACAKEKQTQQLRRIKSQKVIMPKIGNQNQQKNIRKIIGLDELLQKFVSQQ